MLDCKGSRRDAAVGGIGVHDGCAGRQDAPAAFEIGLLDPNLVAGDGINDGRRLKGTASLDDTELENCGRRYMAVVIDTLLEG